MKDPEPCRWPGCANPTSVRLNRWAQTEWQVECLGCNACGPEGLTADEAVAAWNAGPKPSPGILDIIAAKDAEIDRFKAWLGWADTNGLARDRLGENVPWVIRALDGEEAPT